MKKTLVICIIFLSLLGRASSSARSIDSLLSLIPTADEKTKVDLYNTISKKYWYSNPDKSRIYSKKALTHAFNCNYIDGKIVALDYLSISYKNQSKHDSSLFYLRNAESLCTDTTDSKIVSDIYNHYGNLYSMMERMDSSLIYHVKALKIREKIGDKKLIASSLNNIGIIYYLAGDLDRALEHYRMALDICEKIGYTVGASFAIGNLGNIYYDKGNLDSSLEYLFRSVKLHKEQNSWITLARNYQSIGSIYLEIDDLVKAEKFMNLSLELAEKTNDRKLISTIHRKLGELFESRNQIDKAIDHVTISYNIAYKIEHSKNMFLSALLLSDYLSETGRYKEAHGYLEIAYLHNDSLKSAERSLALAKITQKYETEKKQKQFELRKSNLEIQETKIKKEAAEKTIYLVSLIAVSILAIFLFGVYRYNRRMTTKLIFQNEQIEQQKNTMQEANSLIAQKNIELTDLNATKDKFFSIIAHDLINPIGSIVKTSDLLNNDYNELYNTEKIEIIKLLRKTSHSVFSLLENLLTWSRSQKGALKLSPQIVVLQYIVNNVVAIQENLAKNKQITIVNEINSEVVAFADVNMLTTIIRNLLVNAIKFSYEGSSIEITAIEQTETIEVSISDHGVGMTAEEKDKVFRIDVDHTSIGTGQERGSGLGLILCKEFCEKHGGSIEIKSRKGEGSSFAFVIPKNELAMRKLVK
jgi:signal transduction histidine kinase